MPTIQAICVARCANSLNFATRDLIYSCYASNLSNSCLQGARDRAAVVSAADRLNDGFTYTSPFAVGHGFLATGLSLLSLFLLKPLFLPGG